MGRNARKRISYVLPLANSAGGHRLGVNGLAVDSANSILYSGGRDGVICAWDLNLNLSLTDSPEKPPATSFRQQVQAHTHWINDIVLAQNNDALISASSDITVKLWRPNSQDNLSPQTIGLHSDYVKCLASPGPQSGWVASGGLDRKICLWDLNGTGQQSQISVGEDSNKEKGSVYALAASETLLASGGPESVVRVWDPRSGKRVTNFVGHTDNVRDILINHNGDMLLTASSDQTVKVWSMTAGRCMYTLTMHHDSVWSLYSNHPQLSVFYSSDRSGLVAKTDVRNCTEMDQGLSVAVCQEHNGVNKVISAGDYLWTATSSSSINRYKDVNTEAEIALPDNYRFHRMSVGTTRSRYPSPPTTNVETSEAEKLPIHSMLRISNTAPFPVFQGPLKDSDSLSQSQPMIRRTSDMIAEPEVISIVPIRNLPDDSIEGQNGLIKHVLLNDRRRVLTLDTAGEVMLWDLLHCVPVKSFGKRHLEDVLPEVNTTESVAHWCAVDTRTGSLTCALEENYCFDAEMYADEVPMEEDIEFREDQRINLGKWVLRYLFSNLIDEEIKRDEVIRQSVVRAGQPSIQRPNAPPSIALPNAGLTSWNHGGLGPGSGSTLRANGKLLVTTPGLHIGIATPGLHPVVTSNSLAALNGQSGGALSPTLEESAPLEKSITGQSQPRTSADKGGADYFSVANTSKTPTTPGGAAHERVSESHDETQTPISPSDEKGPGKEGFFGGKKFRMAFGMKKLGKERTNEVDKPVVVEEKKEDSDSQSTKTDDRIVEDSFYGVLQRIKHGYEDQLQNPEHPENLTTGITPSLPNDTPVLKPPLNTTILIQEDRPDSGGVADLFEGQVGTLAQQADLIEKVAPMWLGEVLLRNTIPFKDIVKVSFVLEPYQNLLPVVATDGNNRLNANRMLRARKILAYVAERIEPAEENPPEDALKPEDYLELYCNDKLVPMTMTLATMRTHVWRGGGDVLLYYKANGRKEIQHAPTARTLEMTEGDAASAMTLSEAGSRSSEK
ncbi:WD40 repeat-like protein [Pseudovirgaria hyperparasitica]|uniref:WD40 repeat-like protein n=1 Tax=Pseudovirgaria hyperparasitica TaxID=470096 RepID=A0A6A6WHM7_9PEZI|nr:WD40 repeat-like protein [Pseudovirgaria hyperparasitica]KAF2761584.1 WD40 repeat-like protein [Pseudovirgaria hyperparasitica]